MSQKVSDFLEKQKKSSSHQQYWVTFDELYNKKLWHQLTIKLLEFIHKEKPTNSVEIYENFISDFETRIKPLSLVEIASYVVKEIPGYEDKLKFLEKIKEKVKSDNLSVILCDILSGQIKLEVNDFKGTKTLIEDLDVKIDNEYGLTKVHALFYQLASDYYQKIGDHAEYYRNALRYLGCCSSPGIDIRENDDVLAQRAFTLSLAAILAQDIFNFGELLLHPILTKLKPEHEYMRELLLAFNTGNIAKFDELKPKWQTQPDLVVHELEMRKKICLLCLMEMAFAKPNTPLTFKEIADATRLPVTEIELLVMKALSKGLVRGHIDEVESNVLITWIQPRVLNKDQIHGMRSRLEKWVKDIDCFSQVLESKAHDIMA